MGGTGGPEHSREVGVEAIDPARGVEIEPVVAQGFDGGPILLGGCRDLLLREAMSAVNDERGQEDHAAEVCGLIERREQLPHGEPVRPPAA